MPVNKKGTAKIVKKTPRHLMSKYELRAEEAKAKKHQKWAAEEAALSDSDEDGSGSPGLFVKERGIDADAEVLHRSCNPAFGLPSPMATKQSTPNEELTVQKPTKKESIPTSPRNSIRWHHVGTSESTSPKLEPANKRQRLSKSTTEPLIQPNINDARNALKKPTASPGQPNAFGIKGLKTKLVTATDLPSRQVSKTQANALQNKAKSRATADKSDVGCQVAEIGKDIGAKETKAVGAMQAEDVKGVSGANGTKADVGSQTTDTEDVTGGNRFLKLL